MSEQLKEFPQKIPLLALRGLVLFPNMVLHFDVGRQKSMLALNDVMGKNRKILLVAQKDVRDDEPTAKQLYSVGVVAEVRQIVKSSNNSLRVLVEGLYRARVLNVYQEEPFFKAEIDELPMARPRILRSAMVDALMRTVKDLFEEYCYLSPKMPQDMVTNVLMSEDPIYIAEYIAGNISLPVPEKQKVLELSSPLRRLEYLAQILESENEILSLEQDIHDQVREQIDKNQREYYLREQMKVISAELGDTDNPFEEIEKYTTAIMKLGLPEADCQTLIKEAERLGKMPSNSHEAGVVRGYLDTVLALPWNNYTKDKIDIAKARKLLDKEHYGMKRVKERVLEILAVRKLAPDLKGQIICLVGPPGVGKTSIARSIAQTMNRKYARMSLGGVRDESDIRGHRKTYIGAMPGRIINAIKQAGSANPLLLLDEIDKLGSDFRGDPSSALLEVLDSEQNFAFRDHFVEIPFDLSNVLFIATANDLGGIPGPLADRMEIIELSSYTREEKFQIAKRHLLPKQLERNGLKSSMLKISDSALYAIIDGYTREAGVRTLERTISSVCRKAARQIVEDSTAKVSVTAKNLTEFLGPIKFRDDPTARQDQVGVANGLAWTAVGGEMLQVEVAVMEGSGKNQFTGSLGDVMKESVSAAITWIRGHADRYGIAPDFYKNKDIHIHFPEGAVPKDGPSAGITTTTAIVSALSGTKVRHDLAMTGEVTLRGRVLPIGGLREKSMAAYKNGMKTVLIPEGNKPDLAELDPVVLENIEFIPVSQVEQVLELALVPNKHRKPAAESKKVKVSSELPRDTAIPQ
ncbi:MAG: endopeptidase La [Oscillospiraceae bacterium]|nr:endopeptidase La [Oscillospiraceae bacterium]